MRRSRPGRYRFCVSLTALLLAGPVAAAEAPVAVTVFPSIAFVGGDVRTTVRAPRDARNRALRFVVESSDYYASSDVQLDGAAAAATHQFMWKSLPGGAYRVEAILLRDDGQESTVQRCFAVLSGEEREAGAAARRQPSSNGQAGC